MATFLCQMVSSSSLLTLGLYHIVSTTRNYQKSPHSYSAKPFHPFPSPTSHSRLRHLQLYLIILFLLIALATQFYASSESNPLLKGRTPVHLFTSLQFAALLFLFFLFSLALLLSDSTCLLPFHSDLFFALASALFFLEYHASSFTATLQTSDLQARCYSMSAHVSVVTSILCVVLAFQPTTFVADVGLGGSICLRGLWIFQTGLSLYVEAFIPEGCHRLLDVVAGVEGSTECSVEESKLRAVAILDLMFLIHVIFVVFIVMVIHAVVAKTVGIRTSGSYEALPNIAASASQNYFNTHIQMKSMTGTQA